MMEKTWVQWSVAIASCCILSGCGGEGDSDTTTGTQTTYQPSNLISGKTVTITQGGGKRDMQAASLPNEEFGGKQMVAFMDDGHHGALNAYIKFLIDSAGAEALVKHLDFQKSHSADPRERLACEKFIDLIKKSYSSQKPIHLEVKDLVHSLLELPSFEKSDIKSEDFLADFAEEFLRFFGFRAFSLWSMDINHVSLKTGETRAQVEHSVRFFGDAHVDEADSQGNEVSLQQAVDVIQRDSYAWNMGLPSRDRATADIKVTRSISTPDAQNLRHFSIGAVLDDHREFVFRLDDRVTLSVFDEKAQTQMLLTLEPSSVVYDADGQYGALIKSSSGQWYAHDNAKVEPVLPTRKVVDASFVTLKVINVAPAG